MPRPYFLLIAPFGSDSQAGYKQGTIQEVAEEFDLEAHFPSYNKETPAFKLDTTIKDLQGSEFVLVDLSLERPSCYYELGIAEALGKKIYLIAKRGTDIHQTANRNFVRFYDDLNHLRNTTKLIFNEATTTDLVV